MSTEVKKAEKFGWEGVAGFSFQPSDKYSVSFIDISVVHPLRKNTLNDRTYFVVDGEVEFEIEGKMSVLKRGDFVFIPKGTEYGYKPKGLLKIIEVNEPPFDEGAEVVIE